jgi:hypothetical protein
VNYFDGQIPSVNLSIQNMWSRRKFLTSALGAGVAFPLLSGTSRATVHIPEVTGYRVLLQDRYPYPPGWKRRLSGRIFPTTGAAIRAVGRRHHPYHLMPISISEAKENPVQIRLNVGVKSQRPSQ